MNYVDMPNKLTSKTTENAEPSKNIEAINNSLKNIMSTPRGSVPGHPEFGCGINKYIFELLDPLVKESIKAEIEYAVKRWEQRVTIDEIEVRDDPDYNRIILKITYTVKTDIKSAQHEYIYSQQL